MGNKFYIDSNIKKAETLPASFYKDEQVFKDIKEKIFFLETLIKDRLRFFCCRVYKVIKHHSSQKNKRITGSYDPHDPVAGTDLQRVK